MREILFRGQRIYNRKWTDGYYVKRQGDHLLFSFDRMGITRKVIPETVGQFTGLLDKNGKKIFEGDILTSTFGSGDPHSINFGSYYCDGENMIGWYFYPGHTSFGLTIEGNTDAYTVIGNVHENPELLCK